MGQDKMLKEDNKIFSQNSIRCYTVAVEDVSEVIRFLRKKAPRC